VSIVTIAAIAVAQTASAATLFSANFEDGSTSGWSKSGGTWAVVTDGSRVLNQSNAGSENAREFAGSSSWTAYTVQARVKPLSLGSSSTVGLLARAAGSTKFFRLALLSGNRVQLQAVNGSSITVVASASRTVSTGTWYTLAISVNGNSVSATMNGSSVGSGSNSLSATGRIGLQTIFASASFDDVTVTDRGAPTSTSTSRPPTSTSRPPTTTSRPPTSSPPFPNFPTPTGQVAVNGTISVSGTLDGGLRRYCCIGDGSQEESQDPMFELAAGATLQNVIIGAPAGDGVHCSSSCTLRNVWWEDVGEDAATFRGSGSPVFLVDGGGARSATDKVFQHNGDGTLTIQNFQVSNFGKLYRSCGNCSTQVSRDVIIRNVRLTAPGTAVAGININFGDTARFSNVTIIGDNGMDVCEKWIGNNSGDEPTLVGTGADGVNCIYSASDIHFQ
jgi:hypothetical protein